MSNPRSDPLLQVKITRGSLLNELQIIWNEVGESDDARDNILLQIEQECLEVYRRKVDEANRNRAQLRQAIADCEAELAAICSTMGERPVHTRKDDQNVRSLKEELERIRPQVDEMHKRKVDRGSQFGVVHNEIQKISKEIYGSAVQVSIDETDLSLRKLEELHKQLSALQNEKSNRVKLMREYLNTLYSLCSVLGMDFKLIANEVHPSYTESEGGPGEITNDKIQHLAAVIQKLRDVKLQRMEKLQDLAATMLELWHLMDTPVEEQHIFQNVTCNLAASEHELTEPNSLSMEFINNVEAEVTRLEDLKSSKMKELVLRKRSELDEICRKSHMIPEANTAIELAIEALDSEANTAIELAIEALDSGNIDPATVLQQIELQIASIKEESFSRNEVLDKVEKWLAACEEECWLEEYNRDENRYNAGRGAHLSLKRAEKARSLMNKLPGMVETLATKTMAWEKERGVEFLYDGIRLLSMLEEYTILRQEKEEERKRERDQKKLQVQLIVEQEALYGSKPSPSKHQSAKKLPRVSTGGASNRKLSLGGAMIQTPHKAIPHTRPTEKVDKMFQHDHLNFRQLNGLDLLSSGRRGSDVTGHPVRMHSFGTTGPRQPESPMQRKPFLPIAATELPKVSSESDTSAITTAHDEISKKLILTNQQPFAAPEKTNAAVAIEENRTPNVPSTVPSPTHSTITHHGEVSKKLALTNQQPFATPVKNNATVAIEENRTPNVSSTVSAPTNSATTAHGEVLKKLTSTYQQPFSTPVKTNAVVAIEENSTYNVPSTTVSTPMQTAMTPFPLGAKAAEEATIEIEYSFEERRAGFVLSKTTHVRTIQV